MFPLEFTLEKIGQALAGGNVQSIARAVFAHEGIRQHLITRVMKVINDECSSLCRVSGHPVSAFRKLSPEQAEAFSWLECMEELEIRGPTLCDLLSHIVSRSDCHNKMKNGVRHYPGICTAIAVLLKERHKNMCGIHSLVLFSSRVNKKVCVCVCVRV